MFTNFKLIRLLLCFAIARNFAFCSENSTSPKSIETTEVSEVPITESSKPIQTSITPIKPRVLQRTTVLKRVNRHQQENSTKSENKEKDYSTSTTYPSPVSFVPATSKTSDFRPSIHLGEIDTYETRKSSTPFNILQHVNFDNSVKIGNSDTDGAYAPTTSSTFHEAERTASFEERKKKDRVKFFETDSRYGIAVPIEVHHQQQQYFAPQQQHVQHLENNNNNNDDDDNGDGYNYPVNMPVGHEAFVTFVYPHSHYAEVTARPMALGRPVYPSKVHEHMHIQQYEPGIDNVQTIYVKPSKFHGEVEIVTPASVPPVHIQHYDYVTPANGEAMEKPDVIHHQESFQVAPQETDLDNIRKPETVLYLTSHRETAYTRTRQFPYQFYHPGLGQQDNEFHFVQEGAHSYPSKMRRLYTDSPKQKFNTNQNFITSRISPWKKILHLIGTFLPLGLLLATLTPNVVKIGNSTTQPSNIVLSKLRVVDLPVEHKRGRLIDEKYNQQENTCEDRSICELIVSGSEPRSNLLQHILWNLTTKSSDEEAKKHGLHEIFAAVKRKDCSTIDC